MVKGVLSGITTKVRIEYDADGYIMSWATDYTTDNCVEIVTSELVTIVIGASKLVDGHIVTDAEKQKAIEAEQAKELEADQPTDYDAKIAELEAKLDAANQATLELADMMLGGDGDATTSAS